MISLEISTETENALDLGPDSIHLQLLLQEVVVRKEKHQLLCLLLSED